VSVYHVCIYRVQLYLKSQVLLALSRS